jgi:type II secretory pathway component PulJ
MRDSRIVDAPQGRGRIGSSAETELSRLHQFGVVVSRPLSQSVRGTGPFPATRRAATRGFTLLEVLLAIGIAIGLLVVALYFYSQTTELRTQLLAESEKTTAVRLVMDRVTADLRCAYGTFSSGSGVSGDSSSLQIVKTELSAPSAWRGGKLGRAAAPETDLKIVNYSAASSVEGTNTVVSGFVRSEAPLVQERQQALAERRANEVIVTVEPEPGAEAESASKPGPEPLTDAIRFVHFRYWDGSAWQDSWSKSGLPKGVEVSLGAEPLPENTLPEDYPYEVFRRVICLPGAMTNPGGVPLSGLDEMVAPAEEEPKP